MEISSIRIRYVCPVCSVSRYVLCELHRMARHILLPVEGVNCRNEKCDAKFPPFLHMSGSDVRVPTDASIKRFDLISSKFRTAASFNRKETLVVDFSAQSVTNAENAISKIKQRIQEYEEAKLALIKFFNDFLP